MSKTQREKGKRGEREVAALWIGRAQDSAILRQYGGCIGCGWN